MKVKFDKITGCLRESDEGIPAPDPSALTRCDITSAQYEQLDPPLPSVLYVVEEAKGGTSVYLGTLLIAFIEPEPEPLPSYCAVTAEKDDYTGDYLIVHVNSGKVAAGNLANYLIPCADIFISQGVTIDHVAAQLAGAKLFSFGDRRFVDSGTYSGRYSYSISYLNSNNERKFLTYSSSGLSNSSTVGGNNSRWVPVKAEGKQKALPFLFTNVGNTTCRIAIHDGNLQQILSSSSELPSGYMSLSLFELQNL